MEKRPVIEQIRCKSYLPSDSDNTFLLNIHFKAAKGFPNGFMGIIRTSPRWPD